MTDKAIIYCTPTLRDSPAEIRELDLASGKITSLYKLAKHVDLGLSLSPDSQYLLFAQLDSVESDLMSLDGFR